MANLQLEETKEEHVSAVLGTRTNNYLEKS